MVAIKNITPGAQARARLTIAKLYDIPRIRAITGNLVHLDTDYGKAATTDDFIAHDVSSFTSLDTENLTDRPLPKARKGRTASKDHRHAGKQRIEEQKQDAQASAPTRNPRRRA